MVTDSETEKKQKSFKNQGGQIKCWRTGYDSTTKNATREMRTTKKYTTNKNKNKGIPRCGRIQITTPKRKNTYYSTGRRIRNRLIRKPGCDLQKNKKGSRLGLDWKIRKALYPPAAKP